jgi:pyruvate/2-oxoglutarate/acetoin dehydrogenase E1 component
MTAYYFDALCAAMSELAAQPGAIFIGQSIVAGGTAMHRTLDHIPEGQRLELPVFEDTQLGIATGLALAGHLPICVYPRINFLLLAVNQLVLHLDALPIYSDGGYNPRVIIRTAVATPEPLDPGPQHLGDYAPELHSMLNNVKVVQLTRAESIIPAYRAAVERNGSTLLVEYSRMY